MGESSMKREVSFKYIMVLAWPAICEQLLLTMANYVDTAMIGAGGRQATAAVAVNASTTWLLMGLLAAISVGYSVQVAHSLGAEDLSHAQAISRQSLTGAVAFGGILTVIVLLLSPQIPVWLGADQAILKDARSYLFFYSLGLPFQSLLNVFSAILRCAGDTRTPMCVNAGSNLINVLLNYLLIFEPKTVSVFGFEIYVWGAGWGVAGAAAATALSYGIAAMILLWVMFFRTSPVQLTLHGSYVPNTAVLRRMLRLGIPVALERATISLGQLVMTGLVTSLGNVALSANHVAVTAEGISYLPANGIAFAATTLVGQSVGARQEEQAKSYARMFGILGFLAGIFGGLILFIPAVQLAGIFSPDQQVVQLAAYMLRIVAVSEPMFSLTIVLSGVLRGAGNTKAAFWSVAIGMWCVRVTAALFFLHILHLELVGIWLAMVADLIMRGVLSMYWVKHLDWVKICGGIPHEAKKENQ